jgi:glycosyltransferase involved in cell wall biosynthesis
MRVLHVHSGNLYGGVETLLVTLARNRHLRPEMETHFALCFEGRLSKELIDAGSLVHMLDSVRIRRPMSVLRSRRILSQLLRRERYDVIICHSAWSQAIFGPAMRKASAALVFWLHGVTKGRHWLERWARMTPPDLALCNSRFTASSLPNLYPHARSEVIYCPVELPGPTPSRDVRVRLRAELDTHEDSIVIIQVGRMEAGKGHELHLEALSLIKHIPGWTCWQVGGTQRTREVDYVDKLKEIATRLGVGDRVRFLGQRADIGELLAAADIHCQPNVDPEGFGITFIEALYAGLPNVTSAIGGAKEIVDNSCGLLVPPDDANSLAECLRHLIEDGKLREELGKNGPSHARQLCDPATQIQKIYRLLTSTLDRKAAFVQEHLPATTETK